MGEPAADAVVSLRMSDGGEASFPLRQVQGRQVAAAVPWRKARSARGQVHPADLHSLTQAGLPVRAAAARLGTSIEHARLTAARHPAPKATASTMTQAPG
jgi:hypothetical protein